MNITDLIKRNISTDPYDDVYHASNEEKDLILQRLQTLIKSISSQTKEERSS